MISTRVISMSYPWIGLPMEMFRANNQSSVPFILSHITRSFMSYHVVLCCCVVCSAVMCVVLCCVVVWSCDAVMC